MLSPFNHGHLHLHLHGLVAVFQCLDLLLQRGALLIFLTQGIYQVERTAAAIVYQRLQCVKSQPLGGVSAEPLYAQQCRVGFGVGLQVAFKFTVVGILQGGRFGLRASVEQTGEQVVGGPALRHDGLLGV